MKKEDVISFFDKHAPSWNENMITDDEKMDMILNVAGVKKGSTVLDIACGTGIMIKWYLERNVSEVFGVDISPCMIDIAKKDYSKFENISFACLDAEEYSFDEQYDCVMVFNAFPHFVDSEKLVENLFKATKNGGSLTIAHDRGRKALDMHHSGEACKISKPLINAEALGNILANAGYSDIKTISDDNIYIVSGTKFGQND